MIGLISSLFNFDTPVQILDADTFQPVFQSSNPMKITVTDEKKFTRFQVESGEERNDHVIKNAVEISIDFTLTGRAAKTQFEAMKQAYEDNRLLIVQTGMATYESMLIESFPHDETVNIFNGATLPVKFVEYREIQPEYGELQQKQVSNPSHSSTAKRGSQQSKEASPDKAKKATVFHSAGKKVGII